MSQSHTQGRGASFPFHSVSSVYLRYLHGGIFPPKVLYSPAKEPLYQAKVGYFCSEKLSASRGEAPDPMNRGCASGPRWENSPQTPSSDVHPLVSTVSGLRTPPVFGRMVSKYCVQMLKSFSFLGTSSPRPPTGALPLDHTGALSKFLSPSSPSCIKWK